VWPLEYLIKKPLVTTKRTTINLFKIKSCNELQRILLICIYLKTGVTYRFLILNAYTDHTDTQHLLEQGCEDPWLFFEAGRDLQTKIFRKHCPIHFRFSINSYKAHVLLFNSRQERFYFYFFFNYFFFYFKKASRPALGSSQPPVQRLPGALLSRKDSDRNVKLTTHLHLMPGLRMSAAIPSLPYIPLHGMYGDTFTFQQYFWRVLDGSYNKSTCYSHHVWPFLTTLNFQNERYYCI